MISGPHLNRPNRRQVSFFVNRRWATPRNLGEALEAAYRPFFPRGRHPFAVIFIETAARCGRCECPPGQGRGPVAARGGDRRGARRGGAGAVAPPERAAERGFHSPRCAACPPAGDRSREERAPWDEDGPTHASRSRRDRGAEPADAAPAGAVAQRAPAGGGAGWALPDRPAPRARADHLRAADGATGRAGGGSASRS